MQACIKDYYKLEDAHGRSRMQRRRGGGPPKFVDLFAGVGGASEGAAQAGYDVVLAVDADQAAMELHARNHPQCTHLCCTLPPTGPLPLPSAGESWHLHGSPPCTAVSVANQSRIEEKRDGAINLIGWFIEFAIASSATSWSMEQVASPVVLRYLETLKAAKAPHRNCFAYAVVNFYDYGVPQLRRRVIAGSPEVVAHLLRLPHWHRCVGDVIVAPRGTHLRTWLRWSNNKPDPTGEKKWVYKEYTDEDSCVPITGPARTVTAGYALRWARPGRNFKPVPLTPKEQARLQCFPFGYDFGEHTQTAIRCIGNALPPIVMQQLLARKRKRAERG
jgi:DNA (cytosine-5)-methyltransferase 1